MDRSMDSIGSCSLDIDADSTDFSTDTSESLNFLSPSSTREDFTAGIAERCRKLQQPQPLTPKLILNQPINRKSNTTTAYFDIESGKINTIVSRANGGGETNGSRYFNGNSSGDSYLSTKTIELASPTVVAHANKKPSYLNLACCVNGYSNYTTYDSQERKDINKSREVSPIRPIINSLNMSRQQRSNDNLLVPNTTSTTTFVKTSPLASITTRFSGLIMNGDKDTTDNAGMNGSASVDSKLGNRKSFIQQRVEKLYGLNSSSKIITTVKSIDSLLSNGNGHAHNGNGTVIEEKENDEDSVNSLPVMKHLRPEFAKQLKFCNSSPKKSSFKLNGVNGQNGNLNTDISAATVVTSNVKISLQQQTNTESLINAKLQSELELNEPVIVANMMVSELEKENVPMAVVNGNGTTNNGVHKIEAVGCSSAQGETKDGHYFLQLLIVERNRILKMADDMEKDMELAQTDPSIELSEDMIGLLLAAIGKSRLLATKKFKQFEGLCQTNLNPNKEEAFETRAGDLQGFWDMMLLQVDNVDASHREILECKKNGWEKPQAPSPSPPKGSRMTKRPLTQSTKTKTSVPVKKPSTAPVNPAAALKREEQRKLLMEMKRKQKATIQNNDELVVVIGSNDNNGSGECETKKPDLEIFL